MKRILYIGSILVLLLVLLCACTLTDDREPYQFEREEITRVEGRQQATLVTLSESQCTELFDLIESLELRATENENELMGWCYFFDVYHSDGTKTRFTVLDRYITINGYICDSNPYNYEIFGEFFE